MVIITSPLLQPNEIAGKTYKIQKRNSKKKLLKSKHKTAIFFNINTSGVILK